MKCIGLLIVSICLCGCATGPLFSVGPLSELYGQHADKCAVVRSSFRLSNIPAEKRERIFQARSMGIKDNEIAAGVGLDLLAVKAAVSQSYKWYEYVGQAITALADAGLYLGTGVGAVAGVKAIQNAASNSGNTGNLTITGNVSDSTIGNNSGTGSITQQHNQRTTYKK